MARPRRQLLALTNRSRASAGLRSLRVDSTPTSVARWRSRDMIERDYFSHDIPGYGRLQAPRSGRATATCWPARTSAGTRTSTTTRPRSTPCSWTRPAIGTTSSSGAGRRSASARSRGQTARRCGPSCSRTGAVPRPRRHRGPPREPPQAQAPDDAEAHAQADSQAHAVPDAGADAGADREPDAGSAHPADSDARAPSGRGAGARRTSGDDGDGTAGRVVVLEWRPARGDRGQRRRSPSAHDDRGGY